MQLHKLKVHAPEVIRLIPDDELAKLAKKTKVDYCSKVLTGERMFYLLLYAFLMSDRMSQRSLEAVFASDNFKLLFNYSADMKVTRSSISTRLSNISLDFFEQSYSLIYDRLSALYTDKEIAKMNLVRIDSTMVAETCNKLKEGFTVGRKAEGKDDRKQIKYTMAYDGFAAKLAEVLSEPTYLSEDKAMPKVLEGLIKKDKEHENLYVLDRGFMALANYKAVTASEAVFIGRINTNRKMEVVRSLLREDMDRNLGRMELVDDVIVRLYKNSKEVDTQEFRVVKARFRTPTNTERRSPGGSNRKKTENQIYFITNVTNETGKLQLSPQEIAEAYRRRWEIEVFYRFLKQNLSFSHFLSTSENGIKVILYMTLITAMLIMIYKRLNDIGYTEAKFCFKIEIMDWLLAMRMALEKGNFDHRAVMKAYRKNRIP